MIHRAVLGLGSSLGDKWQYLRLAIILLHHQPNITVVKQSFVWASLPMGETANNVFFNMVIEIETDLSASELLTVVLQIEKSLGRTRTIRWSDRTIDIDILLYDEQIIQEPDLSIPHPGMLSRGFVIQPLLELDSHWIHPIKGRFFKDIEYPLFIGVWKNWSSFLALLFTLE